MKMESRNRRKQKEMCQWKNKFLDENNKNKRGKGRRKGKRKKRKRKEPGMKSVRVEFKLRVATGEKESRPKTL